MPDAEVAAVILAAGGSTRFGSPKQLLDWQGRPLVANVADVAWSAGLSPTVVVVGAEAERVRSAVASRPVQILRNYRWETGVSTSLAVGLAALPSSVAAAVFLPVDQPCLTPQLLQALRRRWERCDADIVVPTWEGERGGPVLFGRALFPELAQLSGDVGGRALFDRHAERLCTLPVEDPQVLRDVDTPEAYARLKAEIDDAQDPADVLRNVRAVICDMDGVLWRGGQALPGLQDFFDFLAARALPYTLITNNSSRTPDQYVAKLSDLGVETDETHVLNSAMAAADHLAEIAEPGALVYPVGGPGVLQALQARGFRLSEGDEADYVVVGWDPDLTWERMAKAALLIRGGAPFIGTNPDATFPSEEGLVPGAGAQLAMLETATDVTPVVAGKPEPILYRQALARMGVAPEETGVLGDRLDTDILGGVRLGMTGVLMLSGIHGREDLPQSPIHPDLVFENLAALMKVWRALP
jgi:4-nitrophenyl phosphatase